MKIELLPDWQNKNLPCSLCGSHQSVKYMMEHIVIDVESEDLFGEKKMSCLCNKCALRLMTYVQEEEIGGEMEE